MPPDLSLPVIVEVDNGSTGSQVEVEEDIREALPETPPEPEPRPRRRPPIHRDRHFYGNSAPGCPVQ